MNRDAARFVAPVLAVALFAFVLSQTVAALRDSGVWRFGAQPEHVAVTNPLADLDAAIGHAQAESFPGAARDPFGFVAAAPRPDALKPVGRRPAPPPVPENPVLTAIVYDADPRALVRWKGRDFTVRAGGLFDEFVVVSISREQVVLRRGSDNLVLQRKPQGD